MKWKTSEKSAESRKCRWYVFICFANAIVVFNFPHLHFSLDTCSMSFSSAPKKDQHRDGIAKQTATIRRWCANFKSHRHSYVLCCLWGEELYYYSMQWRNVLVYDIQNTQPSNSKTKTTKKIKRAKERRAVTSNLSNCMQCA